MKTILVVVVLLGAVMAVQAQDKEQVSEWRKKVDACKCIKNEKGHCMTIASRRPAYSRGLGIAFQFIPSCVDNCLPGWSEIYGLSDDTKRELSRCYVDWKRLRKLNPQWSDPNWRP